MFESRAPQIAIATACVALVLALIALVVVARRSTNISDPSALAFETAVDAKDVAKLRRDVIDISKQNDEVVGAVVTDDNLRIALGLREGDVITALAGRTINRELDVTEAVAGAASFDADTIYVDVARGGEMLVLRWKLDGSLRAVRREDSSSSTRPSRPTRPSLGIPSPDPFASGNARDPVLDTIRKVDVLHYEIPKSTVDRVFANPMDFAKGARVVPGMSMGRVEGLKLYAIRPNSIYGAIGLENGDLVRTVNGFELGSMDKVLELYTKLRDATTLEIELTRRGSDKTIRIDIQ